MTLRAIFEIPLERQQDQQDDERDGRRDRCHHVFARARGHPNRGIDPNRRCCRQTLYMGAAAHDGAGADEAYAGHDLRGDAIRCRAHGGDLNGDRGEERRANRDQDVRPQPRWLVAPFSFYADEGAEPGREQQTKRQVNWWHSTIRMMHVVYLVPLGRRRYELYTEPADEGHDPSERPDGFFRQQMHRLHVGWQNAVQAARRGEGTSRWARLRDWIVRRAAETIAEQRTLWSLRQVAAARLCYPSDMSSANAADVRTRILAVARRHHGIWLIVDGVLFAASGLFMLVPGPNVFAYYFGFRVLGHLLSWRGARYAMDRTVWEAQPEPALAELGTLAAEPRAVRAPRVQAIADRLNLPKLAAFFERAAVPAR